MNPITFDDGSTFDIGMHQDLRKAFNTAFTKLDPVKIEVLVIAAVDWFWAGKKEPTSRGQIESWKAAPAHKGALAQMFLTRLLYHQLVAGQNDDLEKFTFKVGNEETIRAMRGKAALKAANDFSRAYLFGFGKQSLLETAMRFMKADQLAEARDVLEAILDLDPEDGVSMYWLGILLQRQNVDATRARQLFHLSAERLPSPYLDRACCPSCGWIPGGQALWPCEGCRDLVDIFEGHGSCPKCSRVMAETLCVACGKKSPNAGWWITPS